MEADDRSWADVVRGVPRAGGFGLSHAMLQAGCGKEAILKYSSLRHQWQNADESANKTYPTDYEIGKTMSIGAIEFSWSEFVVNFRLFFSEKLDKGTHFPKHLYFSKLNSFFLHFCKAIMVEDSYLLRCPILFAIAVLHICVKTELRKSENDYRNLLKIEKGMISFFTGQSGPHRGLKQLPSTKLRVIKAEFELMQAAGWYTPIVSSFEVMYVIFERLQILTKHEHGRMHYSRERRVSDMSKLTESSKMAKDFLMHEIIRGRDCGYGSAKRIVCKCLTINNFDEWMLFDASTGSKADGA